MTFNPNIFKKIFNKDNFILLKNEVQKTISIFMKFKNSCCGDENAINKYRLFVLMFSKKNRW